MKPFLLIALLFSSLAAADPQLERAVPAPAPEGPQKVGLFAGLGYLGSPGAHGSALTAGVRLAMGRHVALSFDLGWGLITASPVVHDRWWLMPAVAFVIPVGSARFELGAGVGLATSSGYEDLADFIAAPFSPDWAFQLAPAARGHAIATIEFNSSFDAFTRLDAGSLLLEGNTIGWRHGNPNPKAIDTVWINLSVGVSFRLL